MMATTTTTAAAADSSSNTHSPRSPSDGGKLRRSGLPAPWAQVVRGAGDSTADSASASPPAPSSPVKADCSPPENFPAGEVSDKANSGNVGGGKKPAAWSKPSNGASASVSSADQASSVGAGGGAAASGGVVVGASGWPALSESTRQKASLSDYPKSTPEASSVPVSQGPPVASQTQPPNPKQGGANSNHTSSTNSAAPPARQRSMKRGGGGGGGGNRQGGFARGPPAPPPPPVFPVPEMSHSHFGNMAPIMGHDPSARETRPTGGFASHPHPANDHSNQRSSNRRGNFGHHGRGDGRNNYHGGRRDQDHGNHDWSSTQNQHVREGQGHPHRPYGRGFMRPLVQGAAPAPFATPQTLRPYGNAMVYADMPHLFCYPMPPDAFRVPYFAGPPPSPPYVVASDSQCASIVKQIDYYFSDANLVKDEFLRSKMDDQGWVPITLIASFPRVQFLTDSIPFILDCLRVSTVVEVQGDKIRRREGWMKWIAHSRSPSDSGAQSPAASTYNKLATSFQKASLEEMKQEATTV